MRDVFDLPTLIIGFKEFLPFLIEREKQKRAEGGGGDEDHSKLEKLLQQCLVNLKVGTRQYAKRQLSWIRNRFLNRNLRVLSLDTSDVKGWDERIRAPSVDFVNAFLTAEEEEMETESTSIPCTMR